MGLHITVSSKLAMPLLFIAMTKPILRGGKSATTYSHVVNLLVWTKERTYRILLK